MKSADSTYNAAVRKLRPLIVVLPSVALGTVIGASVTTTASASPRQTSVGTVYAVPYPQKVRAQASSARLTPKWEYKIVGSESDLNRLGAKGFEYCGEAAAISTAGSIHTFTMKRRK